MGHLAFLNDELTDGEPFALVRSVTSWDDTQDREKVRLECSIDFEVKEQWHRHSCLRKLVSGIVHQNGKTTDGNVCAT